jgi:signal transduction histidine kinase
MYNQARSGELQSGAFPTFEDPIFLRTSKALNQNLFRHRDSNLLSMLHSVVVVLQDRDATISTWLSRIVSILHGAWKRLDLTGVRIKIGRMRVESKGFKQTCWIQTSPFALMNGENGIIEVHYINRSSTEEERQLLNIVTEMLRSAIELRCSNEYGRNLAGMLIEAQEAERVRIARELHDNVNQQVAALSISVSQVKRKLEESKCNTDVDLPDLQKKISDIVKEIRNVSHDLHPAILRHTGLAAAARSNCTDFSRRNGIRIEFITAGDVDHVSNDIALCIYRILQESLHNIQSHAGASKVSISLTRSSKQVELVVSDNGRGFDQSNPQNRHGLGLLSMDERARMVKGEMRITTQRSSGTSLQVRIPV